MSNNIQAVAAFILAVVAMVSISYAFWGTSPDRRAAGFVLAGIGCVCLTVLALNL